MNIQTNLPLELSSLVGRDSVLSELRQLIGAERLVTLTGPGGTGKTRIAKKVARSLAEDFEHGVWFIDLTGVFRDSGVAGAVSRVLGLLEEGQIALSETIARQLADRSILLVLDNCEQVLAGCAEMVETILANAPDARVLATSREPMHLTGEYVRQILPLRIDDGIALFEERARQAGSPITLSDANSATVGAIVERLDGVPLAIELAAARTSMMGTEQILTGLNNRFDLLTGGTRNATEHHKSLRASVAWSYDLMTTSEQALARQLCVLRGFTLNTAEAIGADVVPDGESILDLLQRLVDMSIVQVERSGVEPRYRFLETVREFLLETLTEAGETNDARSAHLAHFIEFAEYRAQRLILGDGPELMAQIQTEFDNLEDALVFAESQDDPSLMFRLLTALTGYYEIWGQYQHGMRWFDKALARSGAPDVLTARALWGASHVCAYGGRMDLAYPRAQRALEMAQQIGDVWTEARALDIIGFAQSVSEPAEAYKSLSRCIELGGEIKDDWAETHGIKIITSVYLFSHEVAGGSASIENVLAIADKHQSRYLRAWANAVKGYFARDGGDLDAAKEALAVSIENAGYVGDPATGGFAIAWSAALKADRGQVDEARREMLGTMQTANVTGTFLAVPETMFQLGMIEVGAGNPQATLDMIGGHVEGLNSAGIPVWAAQLAVASAAAQIALGGLDEAKALLDDAEEMSASLKNPFINGLICYLRGRHALARGDIGETEARLHKALEIQRDAGLLPGLLRTMEAIASVLVSKDKPEDAARVLAFIDKTRSEIRFIRGAAEDTEHESLIDQLDQILGDEAHSDINDTAASADLEEIIGLISRMRGKRARPLMGWDSLTPTERRVVSLATEGLSNPEIAERMFIARGTVKVHLSHIYEKLDVKSRTQLAAKAVADEF
ncbi:LuxR C-terminal-related transcriptional regulator [Aliiroseovarius sp. KMU-50]|uniref:LuxR C-terminal-related transcriptional regulator n=1 Tax=Aliiroseovarius salicola TaxID=3009082 RepID=A0ABT4W3R2_9RHOB|nr:LuxR C-terminal-related transcriptional regulator [Aliiroseovarius sp. KMU-50]MDA5095144.1 LuxR C-terminal-related transcriptional regulator [Aliiroseovarius sp. KMU-50]